MAVIVNSLTPQARTIRRPQHRFQLMHKPWQIQPFLLAPVLPGETMRNALIQARVVTDPIRNPLIGWWIEYYLFYVKHRDLTIRDDLVSMMLDPNNPANTDAAANGKYYYAANAGVDWCKWCLERVVDEYFRDEEDIGTAYTIDTVPSAKIAQESWLDSAVNASALTTASEQDIPLVGGVTGAGANPQPVTGVIKASDVERYMRLYDTLKFNRMVDMSYEDFLRTYGVRMPEVELHRPELIRYIREWSYPTNHLNPADGKPSAAVSWAIAERADKDRFFPEPGFIFGATVARPKVYLKNQVGSFSNYLTTAFDWLPAVLAGDPAHSLKKFAMGTGPLTANADANGYWVDVRDLFLYGDQFMNFTLAATNKAIVDKPTTALQKKYATLADANGLFVDVGAGAEYDEDRWVRQDGVVSLQVATTQRDATPTR